MRRHASVPYVARKIRSIPSTRIKRVAADVPQEPANHRSIASTRIRRVVADVTQEPRIRRVAAKVPQEPADPEPRNQPPAQEFPRSRPFPPEITASQPTPVEGKEQLKNEDIFNLLEGIKGDLDAVEVEVEDVNNGSTIRDPTPKTSRGRDYYAKRESSMSVLEQLPLSPLMHPRLLEARSRFTKAKPLPSKELNEFQRLININPYGMSSYYFLSI